MDLCGFPKTAFWIHQAQWLNHDIVHIVPQWNWAGSEGKPITLMVLSNAETVELRLNGASVAKGPIDKYQMATFQLPYAPGRLEAIATKGGGIVARHAVETTGPPAALRIVADRPTLAGDGLDAEPLTVQIVDAQGRVVPLAAEEVIFTINGPRTIIGLNNGDPTNHESEKGTEHSVFHGLAQIIEQTMPAVSGSLTIQAQSSGLKAGQVALRVATTAPLPAIPAIADPPLMILGWKRSAVTESPQDPNQQLLESDMNSWGDAHPGDWLPPIRHGRYAIDRAHFTPRAATQQWGGSLILRAVIGKAEICLDGNKVAQRGTSDKADLVVPVPPGSGPRTVRVLIEAPVAGQPAGLSGVVTIE